MLVARRRAGGLFSSGRAEFFRYVPSASPKLHQPSPSRRARSPLVSISAGFICAVLGVDLAEAVADGELVFDSVSVKVPRLILRSNSFVSRRSSPSIRYGYLKKLGTRSIRARTVRPVL